MSIDLTKKSSRLLASRRYTHDDSLASQEAFTQVLDLGSDEIYSQALDGFSWGIVGGIIALIMVINLLLKSKFLERFITTDSNVSNLKKNYKKRGKV